MGAARQHTCDFGAKSTPHLASLYNKQASKTRGSIMSKVLLINGSSRQEGNTSLALAEVAGQPARQRLHRMRQVR